MNVGGLSFGMLLYLRGAMMCLLGLALPLIGCGGPTGPAAQSCSEGFVTSGSMSAEIDGKPWASSCFNVFERGTDYLFVNAVDTQYVAVGFRVRAEPRDVQRATVVLTTGTYRFEGPPWTYGGGSFAFVGMPVSAADSCCRWEADNDTGSGTITITSLSATRAVGTFSFSVLPDRGSTGQPVLVVTNGRFNLMF